jgi:ABC-type nitrate/sulfonate/bicarbonate transport system permease component
VRGLVFALFLGGWQLLATGISNLVFATPSETATRFFQLLADGELSAATINTLQAIAVGFALSVIVAVPLGLLMGTSRIAEYSLDPFVSLIYATPLIVVIPVMGLAFGSNMTSTYLIVFLATVFPILINVMAGVKNVSREMIETSHSFGLEGLGLWRHVVLPSALPYTIAGLRIGVSHAVVGAILAEIFLYGAGLGGLIYDYTSLFDTGAMIAAVVVIMVIGIALTEAVKLFEKRISSWSFSARATY